MAITNFDLSAKLNVHSIESFGTHEGPGLRLVVFLQGCHFRCVYCHNPDTWAIQAGHPMSVAEILAQLEAQRPYLRGGGLTVSGGEPLLQRLPLYELFAAAQTAGFHTTLDTNGSILDEAARQLLTVTDLVLLDVKHIQDEQHQRLTGQSNAPTLAFAEYLAATHHPFWLRYVLVPGWTDQPEALHAWAKRLSQMPGLERVEILPYHTLGTYKYEALGLPNQLEGVVPPNALAIAAAQDIFKQYFAEVKVR
jgi:pyruvate formate lyase activating enzyme